jgi:hypothetical protein
MALPSATQRPNKAYEDSIVLISAAARTLVVPTVVAREALTLPNSLAALATVLAAASNDVPIPTAELGRPRAALLSEKKPAHD